MVFNKTHKLQFNYLGVHYALCKNFIFFLENMIRGLDDDEIDFLELVDKTKMAQEKRQIIEETRQIEEFRTKVNTLQYETAVIPWVVTNPKPYTVNSGVV